MDGFPDSYRDPLYDKLDAATEQQYDLPAGLLTSVRVNGEKTNANQVSDAGAKTPYQFTPATRTAILDKYGIDVTLNPKNASDGAGILLRDSLQRNDGNPELAVREYHGGTNRDNWGPINNAYAKRVLAGHEDAKASALDSGFSQFMAANPAVPAGASAQAAPGAAPAPALPDQSHAALSAGFGDWLTKNPGQPKPPEQDDPGLIDRVKESITGAKRRTPETDAAPDWTSMPELASFTMDGIKTGLGTLMSNPAETVQIIQHNFPGVKVTQDDHGNYFMQSSIDGKRYAIKPGFQPGDIVRAGSALAAFTPAGRATTLLGSGAAAAGTQALIEGSQAATGGNFDTGDVAMAGLMGAAVPAAMRVVGAAVPPARQMLQSLRGTPDPVPGAAPLTDTVAPATADAMQGAAAESGAAPTPAATPSYLKPVPDAAPVEAAAPLASTDLANTARTAAEGGMGSKSATQVLAEQAAPDAKAVEAAKRLGIEDYLQPDHVTSNQAYRELAQAVKSVPGSEARAAEMTGLQQVAKRADDLVEQLGGTHDLAALDSGVKKTMQDTYDTLKTKAGALYDEVRAAVPAKSEAPADNVLGMIRARADELGGDKNLSSMEKMILGKLTPKMQAIKQEVPGLPGGTAAATRTTQVAKPPNYALLDDVRRDLTAAKYGRQGPFKDSDDRLVTMLEGALRKDQQSAAERYGMGAKWNLAQSTAQSYKAVQSDLTSLFGKNLDQSIVGDLGRSVSSLPKGDIQKFVGLVKATPDSLRQEVVASGLNTAFGKSAQRGSLNFNSYANWYEGLLRNKQAHAAVMSNLPPQARKQLSDLYRISRAIGAATKERITTGRINAVTDQIKGADSLVSRLYDTAKRSSLGAVAATAAAHIPLVGPGAAAAVASALAKGAKPSAIKAVDTLIASPEFIAMVKQVGTAAEKPATLRLVHSKPFSNFVRAVGLPHEMSNREKWVTQAMQAENQQGN